MAIQVSVIFSRNSSEYHMLLASSVISMYAILNSRCHETV